MSTITVVKKDGYAAIAADTMTTQAWSKETADYIVNHEKILKVGEHHIAITGPTSTKLILKHYFTHLEKQPDLSNVDSIFAAWMHVHEAKDILLRAT